MIYKILRTFEVLKSGTLKYVTKDGCKNKPLRTIALTV